MAVVHADGDRYFENALGHPQRAVNVRVDPDERGRIIETSEQRVPFSGGHVLLRQDAGLYAFAVVDVQVFDQIRDTERVRARFERHGYFVAVDVDVLDAAALEDLAGEPVVPPVEDDVAERVVSLVRHAGEVAVGFEPKGSDDWRGMFGDVDGKTHSARHAIAYVCELVNPSNATVARVVFVACVVAVAVFGGILAIGRLSHIITLLVVALFFAVILAPPVDFLVRKARFPRGAAVAVVFLAGVLAFSGMTYAFVRPIVDQSQEFVDKLPTFVEDSKAGHGRVGELVKKYNLDKFVEDNQDKLKDARTELGKRAVPLASTFASSVADAVTVLGAEHPDADGRAGFAAHHARGDRRPGAA